MKPCRHSDGRLQIPMAAATTLRRLGSGSSARHAGLAPAVLLGICCFTLGIGAATFVDNRHTPREAYAAGACMAIEMVNAHMALEEPTRQRVMRALTSILNPYRDKFPERHASVLQICEAVQLHRYPGAFQLL